MEVGQTPKEQPQPVTFAAAPINTPVQLELPSTPKAPASSRRSRGCSTAAVPVHLMFDVEDIDCSNLGEGDRAPVLYTHDGTTFKPATERDVFTSAQAILQRRFYRGLAIAHYPRLLKRLLLMNLGHNRRSTFFAFYLDEKGCLIQLAELFRGSTEQVNVYTKEIVRHAIDCDAVQVLCARTDPGGRGAPAEWDVGLAKRLRHSLQLVELVLVDYVVVGKAMTSLAKQGCFRPEAMRAYS